MVCCEAAPVERSFEDRSGAFGDRSGAFEDHSGPFGGAQLVPVCLATAGG